QFPVLSDFSFQAQITSLKLSGKRALAFTGSTIGASQLGKIDVGSIPTTDSAAVFGLAANGIASLKLRLGSRKLAFKNLLNEAGFQDQLTQLGVDPATLHQLTVTLP